MIVEWRARIRQQLDVVIQRLPMDQPMMAQHREGVIGRHPIQPAPNIRLRRARDKWRFALACRLPGIIEGFLHEVERLLRLTSEASQIDMQSMLMGVYQAGKIILGDDPVRLRTFAHE